jgi:GNAT superfamily N-acetyltransferase
MIRPATPDDTVAVEDLLEQLGYPQDDPGATAERIRSWADDPASAVYVADAGGNLLGLVAVHVEPFFQLSGFSGRIVALVVSGRARRQGVATQLMTAAESFAIGRGARGSRSPALTTVPMRTSSTSVVVTSIRPVGRRGSSSRLADVEPGLEGWDAAEDQLVEEEDSREGDAEEWQEEG